ncbi:MAG: FAD:protein FMN transferase, partial [Oscillospiraceae bacterium]|nr:FAD:protein FMN transferase [Oscillospiraceae bacterium]
MRRSAAIIAVLIMLMTVSSCANSEKTAEFFAMDTYMSVKAYGGDAVDEAEALVFELERKLSITDGLSEISAVNEAGSAQVSQETAELVASALSLCELSGGALDISVYSVTRAWGFTAGEYRVPQEAELEKLLRLVDYTKVTVSGDTVSLGEGMLIDLGAVAKGYAGDRVTELLRSHGVKSAIINLGGNVQCLGRKPDGSRWKIGVQDPAGSGYVGVIEAEDEAVITSGGYERFFVEDGKTYWHIIDPSDGRPADSGLISVTVIGKSGLACDGLSTALFVMGKEKAAGLWRENGGFEAVFVTENGDIIITEG